MSMTVWEVRAWLETLPSDATVAIDDGGLTLICEERPEASLEIGGSALDELGEDAAEKEK